MPGVDVGSKQQQYIRIRQENPDGFDKDSFRTVPFKNAKGIKTIMGKKGGKMEVQSVLFPKDKYTREDAVAWIKAHDEFKIMDEAEDTYSEMEMNRGRHFVGSETPIELIESNGQYNFFEICHECDFDDPRYGRVIIKEKNIDNFIRNFTANVRKIWDELDRPILPIDYNHEDGTGDDAAGWICELQKRDRKLHDGKTVKSLWGRPSQVSPDAFTAIKNGKYKFASASYDDWQDPEKGGKFYRDVLFGCALCINPAIRDLTPIQLNEAQKQQQKKNLKKGDKKMKLSEFLLSEGILTSGEVSEEFVEEKTIDKIKNLSADLSATRKDLTEAKAETQKAQKELSELKAKHTELEKKENEHCKKEILQLAEKVISPAIRDNPQSRYSILLETGKFDELKTLVEFAAENGSGLKTTMKLKEDKGNKEDGDEEGEDLAEFDSFDDIPHDKMSKMIKKIQKEKKNEYKQAFDELRARFADAKEKKAAEEEEEEEAKEKK